jgi:predicted RecA/RadA family phage recombinase
MVPCTAPAGGVLSGGGYKIGDLFGVSAVTAAAGAPFELAVAGVYTLPKAAGAIGEGAKVYWSAANANVTTTASGNTLIGHAVGAYAESDTAADIRLSN